MSEQAPHRSQFELTNFLLNGLEQALRFGQRQQELAEAAKEDLERVEQMAMLDHLTGVHNRRALIKAYDALQAGQGQRKTDGRTIGQHCLLAADLDNFKPLNDTHGHNEGDNALQMVARIMNDHARGNDVVARWGGDEFNILLPYTSPEEAAIAAERIRHLVETEGKEHNITLSIGIAAVNLDKSLEENHDLADRAMYEAKAQGRNQAVPYHEGIASRATS